MRCRQTLPAEPSSARSRNEALPGSRPALAGALREERITQAFNADRACRRRKNESWKYTSLRAWRRPTSRSRAAGREPGIDRVPFPAGRAHRASTDLVFVNGHFTGSSPPRLEPARKAPMLLDSLAELLAQRAGAAGRPPGPNRRPEGAAAAGAQRRHDGRRPGAQPRRRATGSQEPIEVIHLGGMPTRRRSPTTRAT